MNDINILIAGGGTGGHIFPGISLYEKFRERKIHASLLVGKRDMSFSPLSGVDRKDLYCYNAPSFTKNILKMPLFLLNFLITLFRSIMLLKRLNSDAVVGMGGYVSAPVLAAARLLNLPFFLCEQNTVPGKVTLFFAAKAKRIFTTFDITKDFFKAETKSKIINAGNPVRGKVFTKASREEARNYFHLRHCKKVILVIGGSQGALQINELFLGIKKLFPNELKDTGIIWITGHFSFKKYKDILNEIGGNGSTYLTPFIDEIGMAYKASDLAISRSGAGGIMEFAAVGLPSILIPYPYAADDHQEKNAEVFEHAGAAIRIPKDEITPERVGSILIDVLSNANQLSRMSESAKSVASVHAAADIIKSVLEELNNS